MDRLIRKALETRGERVKECIENCQIIISRLEDDETHSTNDEIELGLLNQSLERLTNEIQSYLQRKGGSEKTQKLVQSLIPVQYTAEETLTRLQTLIKCISASNSTRNDQQKDNIKSRLPEIQLGTFDGDILKFHGFWDQFCSVIEKRKLDEVDKMMYLRASLEGDALEVIQGLDLTNSNYKIAVDRLKKTFGRPGHIIDEHYRAIAGIPKASSDIADCRRKLNKIEGHFSVLESMGEKINANNSLQHILLDKFPNELMFNFRMDDTSDNQPLETIRRHLERVISSREMTVSRAMPVQMDVSENMINPSTSSSHFTTEALYTGSNKDTSHQKLGTKRKYSSQKAYPTNASAKLFSRLRTGKGHRSFHRQQMNPELPPQKKFAPYCVMCNGQHYTDECSKYTNLEQRKNQMKGRCFICLSKNHLASGHKGTLSTKCPHCQKVARHHRSLCPQKFGGQQTITNFAGLENDTILPTALATISNSSGLSTTCRLLFDSTCRLLFDSGSQRSYINATYAKRIKLEPLELTSLTIFSFGNSKPQLLHSPLVTFEIKGLSCAINVLAYVVPTTTGDIPSFHTEKKLIAKGQPTLHMAPDVQVCAPADIIIGMDYYHLLVLGERKELRPNLYLVNTVLGWVVSGKLPETTNNGELSIATYVTHSWHGTSFSTPDQPLNWDGIKNIWELETIGITDSPKILQDEEIIQYFNQTIQRQNGRYFVRWPWVEYPPNLSVNLGQAIGRLKSLIRHASYDLLKGYDDVLQDQIKKGVVECVKEGALPSLHPVHYLPHHCVIQENKSTKLRIVYDGSAKMKGQLSLNELLYKGPSLLEDLVSLLLQFRQHRVALVADIEKAFLQVGLQEEDRDVTRFVWIKDLNKPPENDNLLHMRFTRVPFGIVSSPFLLSATIRFHLAKPATPFAQQLSHHLYVDNLVTGTETTKGARSFYEEAIKLFDELSMNIRAWNSNDHTFLQSLPPEHCDDKKCTSVLGLDWNTMTDSLMLGVDPRILEREAKTKREVLRIIASVFDPCGWCAPYTLPTRLFLQSLWEEQVKWDTPLTETQMKIWSTCKDFLKEVKNVSVPRYYLGDSSQYTVLNGTSELHCFTDAAKSAYIAAVYLRTKVEDKYIVNLVVSKSRLTPLKQKGSLTTPKLELLALFIGTRLVNFVQQTLQLPRENVTVWSDSTIVLSWLKSERLLTPFVTRRVNEIRQSKHIRFRYVPTEINPADIATRHLKAQALPEAWFHGPAFLQVSSDLWVHDRIDSSFGSTMTGDNTATIDQITEEGTAPSDSIILATNAHSDKCSNTTCDLDISLFPEHGTKLEPSIVRELQLRWFPRESKKEITPLAKNLGLFIDDDGLMRCKGRFANAPFPLEQKQPLLMPKKSMFTTLLIQRVHKENFHVGVSHTLSLLRGQYWIPQGRSKVASVLRACKECIKQAGGPYKLPPMPDLPRERVSYSPPFTYTGLDYFGPLLVTTDGQTVKRYCCLFTCMAVRAVHLELVRDLSCEEFLLGLRRFIAARGTPRLLISDNAAHFTLAASILRSHLVQGDSLVWKFIPALSPWQGGFYERIVGIVKNCLYRSLGSTLLSEVQLQTVLKEIEATVNSRPLTAVGKEQEFVLTPAHFLRTSGPSVVEILTDPASSVSTSVIRDRVVAGWKRTTRLLGQFRMMFENQYLSSLREQHRLDHRHPRVVAYKAPAVGDLVQLKGDSSNRGRWRVGKIAALLRGTDGQIRTVRVSLPGGVDLTRSVSHLFPLELHNPQLIHPPEEVPTTDTAAPVAQASLSPSPTALVPLVHDSTASGRLAQAPPKRSPMARAAARLAVEKIRGWVQALFNVSVARLH